MLLIVFIIILTIVVAFLTYAEKYEANKQAVSYRGTILSYEEVKCIWNEEEMLHPIDIGKVEQFRNLRRALLFSAVLLILTVGLKFIK